MSERTGSPQWRKSTASNPHGNCVELAPLSGGRVGMRNSRDTGGAVLSYPPVAMASFLAAVRDGVLDDAGGSGAG